MEGGDVRPAGGCTLGRTAEGGVDDEGERDLGQGLGALRGLGRGW